MPEVTKKLRCKICGTIQNYTYTPYSLSSAVVTCGQCGRGKGTGGGFEDVLKGSVMAGCNHKKPVRDVYYADLVKPYKTKPLRVQCPACTDGLLLIKPNRGGSLFRRVKCLLCDQRFRYIDETIPDHHWGSPA